MGSKKHQKLIDLRWTQKYLKIVPQKGRKLLGYNVTDILKYGHTRTLEYMDTCGLKIIVDNLDKIWYDSVYTMGRVDTWVRSWDKT